MSVSAAASFHCCLLRLSSCCCCYCNLNGKLEKTKTRVLFYLTVAAVEGTETKSIHKLPASAEKQSLFKKQKKVQANWA